MIDLYRFYNADDELLYIGISLSAVHRASQHRRGKSWWPEVARMTVERIYGDRKHAESVEGAAIRRERPKYNIKHADGLLGERAATTDQQSRLDDMAVELVQKRMFEARVDGEDALDGDVGGEKDPLYDQAVEVVLKNRKASISLVQRHLKIGYNRAARLVEDMENAGLVSSMSSSGQREILVPARAS